jgi:hypothetical protein
MGPMGKVIFLSYAVRMIPPSMKRTARTKTTAFLC